jgi:hypothetical protein
MILEKFSDAHLTINLKTYKDASSWEMYRKCLIYAENR